MAIVTGVIGAVKDVSPVSGGLFWGVPLRGWSGAKPVSPSEFCGAEGGRVIGAGWLGGSGVTSILPSELEGTEGRSVMGAGW